MEAGGCAPLLKAGLFGEVTPGAVEDGGGASDGAGAVTEPGACAFGVPTGADGEEVMLPGV